MTIFIYACGYWSWWYLERVYTIICNISTVSASPAPPLLFWQLHNKELTDFDGFLLDSVPFELFHLVDALNDFASEQLKGLPDVNPEGSTRLEIAHPLSAGQLESLVYGHLLLLYVTLVSQQEQNLSIIFLLLCFLTDFSVARRSIGRADRKSCGLRDRIWQAPPGNYCKRSCWVL